METMLEQRTQEIYMSIYQTIGWGVFAALSFYIPFNAYAERVVCKSKFANSAYPPLLISYAIWYMPIVLLLVGGWLFGKLFSNSFFCWSILLTAILWAYFGHKWVQTSPLEDDSDIY